LRILRVEYFCDYIIPASPLASSRQSCIIYYGIMQRDNYPQISQIYAEIWEREPLNTENGDGFSGRPRRVSLTMIVRHLEMCDIMVSLEVSD